MDNLNKWLGLFANLGVLLGIVFLAIEIRQNTLYLKQGESNVTFDHATTSRLMTMDAGMAELVVKAYTDIESLSDVELFRFSQYANQWMWSSYNIYLREANGYLEKGEWERSGKPIFVNYFKNPAGQWAWSEFKSNFPEDFRELVDSALDE